MSRTIVVAHDLREGGEDALALGKLIASATGAELVVACVYRALPEGFLSPWPEEEARVTDEIARIAGSAGALPAVVGSGSPARGLHEIAEKADADLVIAGSSHRGEVGQVLAGNIGLALLHGASCAVAIAPRGYRDRTATLETIAVGFDGSYDSRVALDGAVELARASGARLRVLAVADPPPIIYGRGAGAANGWHELKQVIEEQLQQRLDEGLETVPPELVGEAAVVSGDPVQTLSEAGAADGAILIVGSRGYGPVGRLLLGSVSAPLMRSARCPVLVYPRGAYVEVDPSDVAASAAAR